jgi:hypothetical protein
VPVVTAKLSLVVGAVVREVLKVAAAVAGQLMWVMAADVSEGRRSWFLNVFQYRCSPVTGEGPDDSLTGWSGPTGAAMAISWNGGLRGS